VDPTDNRGIDWTGVQPDESPIERLDGRTFLLRLRRLDERVRDLKLLRRALMEQQTHNRRVSRDSE
jgi:hypothetical protein